MATTVTKSNLYSEPWQNVYDLINSRTNVNDPVATSSKFRKFVYSRDPDVKDSDFKGYPYIIVNLAEPEELDTAKSLDRKSKHYLWTVEIEVVASDRGANNKNGKGRIHLNAISDDIIETFNSVTNLNTLNNNLLYSFKIEAGGTVTEPNAEELVYRRSFILSFTAKLQVSS